MKYLLRKYSSNVRNIGIIAHVDAGKTTLTEQMLYLSNTIAHTGTVDHGTTVTDFMAEERRRGISIKSSLVSLTWRGVNINLLDTPGHVDFNYEVECALSVMDGCILIIDACKGVQSQTLQVWRQAVKYNLPCLVFVNKMDKLSSNFVLSLQSLKDRLGFSPVVIKIPIRQDDGKIKLEDVSKNECHRDTLLSSLAESDHEFCSFLLESQHTSIHQTQIRNVLANLVKRGTLSAALGGVGSKGVGVPDLLDSVVDLIPDPSQTCNILMKKILSAHNSDNVALYVYKVAYSEQHGGFLAFVRVLGGGPRTISGTDLRNLFKKDKFFCWRTLERVKISAGKLFNVFADDFSPVDSEKNVNFCSILISNIRAGDVLSTQRDPDGDVVNHLPRQPPRPLLVSLEAADSASDRKLVQALRKVEQEDSSIRVIVDEVDLSSITVEAVGPLHLDVIRNSVLETYGLASQIVKTRISYRECPTPFDGWHFPAKWTASKKLGGIQHSVEMTIRFRDSTSETSLRYAPQVTDCPSFSIQQKQALKHGFETSLQTGPLVGAPVEGILAEVTLFSASKGCLSSYISNALCMYLRSCLGEVDMTLHEPHHEFEIYLGSGEHVDSVLSDIVSRRGYTTGVQYLCSEGVRVNCTIPLGEALGYADQLRSRTSGLVELSCVGCSYSPIGREEQSKIIDQSS